MRLSRVARAAGLVSILAVTVLGPPAAAAPFDRVHFHETTDEILKDYCGDLDLRYQFDDSGLFVFNTRGPHGLAYSQATIHGATSWTNLANDRTLVHVYNVVDKDLKITDNGDGTLTVLVMAAGSTKYFGPDGEVFNDPGQLRFELLFDHGGTPGDPSDDKFLADLGVVKPSSGRNDLEGHDLCTDLHDLIG